MHLSEEIKRDAVQDLLLALSSKESACRSTQDALIVNHSGCQVQGIYLAQCKQKVSQSVGNKPGISNAISWLSYWRHLISDLTSKLEGINRTKVHREKKYYICT